MPNVYPWDATFNTTPTFADLVSDGDNDIERTRSTVQSVLQVEHDCGTVDAQHLDTGRHKTGSARAYFQAAAPADLLEHYDSGGGGAWLPVTTQNDRAGSSDLDNGRLWVDWDDCQPYVREQEQTAAAWTPLNANEGTPNPTWISLWPRTWTETDAATTAAQRNVAGAETREEVAGGLVGPTPGGIANVLGVTVVIPNDGRSYQVAISAHCRYVSTNNTAGGFCLVEEDLSGGGPTDVDWSYVQGPHANATAGEATLHYVDEAPTNGETYYYYVEFTAMSALQANFSVNPTDNTGGFANITAANWAGATAWSRIHATVMPYTDDPAVAANYTIDS
jgi:hypothetical protein